LDSADIEGAEHLRTPLRCGGARFLELEVQGEWPAAGHMGCGWGGVVPFPSDWDLGRGLCPQKIFGLLLLKWCIFGTF